MPSVTAYKILSQVGATAKEIQQIFTITFAKVPDQFPTAAAGTIGLGKRKREELPAGVDGEGHTLQTGIAGRLAWR